MDITFEDITNLIKLSAYFKVYAKPVDDEQKNEFQEIDQQAISSLWKIRKELMLEDDYGDSIIELRKKKRDKQY
jgi:hypothetical protein